MFESVLDSLSPGVIFVNRAGILTYLNRQAAVMLNVEKGLVLGKRVDMLPLKTSIYKVMSENSMESPVEINVKGRGVVVRTVEVKDADGLLLGEVTELHDVTEEKKQKRQREDFVAMMTHDLKSPLMVMLGQVQAVKMGIWGEIDEHIHASMEEIERSGINIRSMIDNMLDIYRLEKGFLLINKDLCDIAEILEESCHDGKLSAADKGVNVTFIMKDEIPPAFVDGRQLARLFANLIGNAVKFTPAKGQVVITAEIHAETLRVSIHDTGIGISEKDLPKIFNKFFRSDRVSGFKGTGLGLTISKAIAEAHGGSIEVESVEDKGTTFTATIPLTATDATY